MSKLRWNSRCILACIDIAKELAALPNEASFDDKMQLIVNQMIPLLASDIVLSTIFLGKGEFTIAREHFKRSNYCFIILIFLN